LAVANYAEAKGYYPPAYVVGPDGRSWHSWRALILPYSGWTDLGTEYNFDEPWDGPNNRRLGERMPKGFAFSGTKFPTTTTNYLAVVGKDTMWPGREGRKPNEITDGLSNTILIVENNGLGVHWLEPRDLDFATMDFRLDTPGGVSSWYEHPAVVTVDGTVRRLLNLMSPETLRAALTVNGGEEIGEGEDGWTVLPNGRQQERGDR
jgi:hypothetical protein